MEAERHSGAPSFILSAVEPSRTGAFQAKLFLSAPESLNFDSDKRPFMRVEVAQ